MKFYLRNNYDMSEIKQQVRSNFPDKSEKFVDQLSEDIHGKFYEIAFEIHNDNEGNLVEAVPI